MPLTLDLAPALDRRLRSEAEHPGLPAEELARRLIEGGLPDSSCHLSPDDLAPEEWAREFDAWCDSHDTSVPPLSDEAVSRESMYEGRP